MSVGPHSHNHQKDASSQLLRNRLRFDHMILALLALIIGLSVGYATIGFRALISGSQFLAYGTGDERVISAVIALEWWQLLCIPMVGGFLVGLIQKFLANGEKPESVAEVIEANALREGNMSWRTGLTSALATSISLGVGASAGREGPVVHMGASIASFIAQKLGLTTAVTRTLLACGVASAVAASFNAPIAGVFFALEVVMGHYAIHTFAPVVIAGVAGTIVSRIHIGDFPAFIVPETGGVASFLELPAFAGLGIVCALGAILFSYSLLKTGDFNKRLPIPGWLLPPIGGLLVGLIALQFPEIIGVGYEATDNALKGQYELQFLITLFLIKIIATSVSIGFNFGGGVFGPALFLGAMLGGAYGYIAGMALPEMASSVVLYSMVGMGAFASAVLGAPISTILIIFELTGDYQITIAVMIASAIASLAVGLMHRTSIFYWMLERRGMHLEGGKAKYLLKTTLVESIMDRHLMTIQEATKLSEIRNLLLAHQGGKLLVTNAAGQLRGIITASELVTAEEEDQPETLTAIDICREDHFNLHTQDNLETALALLETTGENVLPVLDANKNDSVVAILHAQDVFQLYNKALLEVQDGQYDLKKRLSVKK